GRLGVGEVAHHYDVAKGAQGDSQQVPVEPLVFNNDNAQSFLRIRHRAVGPAPAHGAILPTPDLFKFYQIAVGMAIGVTARPERWCRKEGRELPATAAAGMQRGGGRHLSSARELGSPRALGPVPEKPAGAVDLPELIRENAKPRS